MHDYLPDLPHGAGLLFPLIAGALYCVTITALVAPLALPEEAEMKITIDCSAKLHRS